MRDEKLGEMREGELGVVGEMSGAEVKEVRGEVVWSVKVTLRT